MKKILAVILTAMLIISLVSGCQKKDETDPTSAATTKAETTKGETTKAETTATEPVDVPASKLTMFLANGGWAVGDVDFSNNPWIEFINEYANVILEVNSPSVADAQTVFNLSLTSGNLPDVFVINPSWIRNPSEGALLQLDDYIKNSPILSAFHPQEVIEKSMIEDDGHIYFFRATAIESKNPVTWNARGDLIDEVYGKVPQTLDEWVDCAKALKQKYPEYIPFSSFGINYLTHFLQSYGVDFTWSPFRAIDGQVVNVWSLPQMKEGLLFYRYLYEEGLLDSTFATNKVEDWVNIYENKGLLVWSGAMYASQPNTAYYYGEGKNMFFINVPTAVAPGVDPKLTVRPLSVVGSFAMAVFSLTKEADAAVRTIEAFSSPEYKEFITFGREGTEYMMVNGKRQIDPDKYDETHVFKSLHRFMWDYHTTESAENTIIAYGMGKLADNPDLYKRYIDSWEKDKVIGFNNADLAGFDPFEFYREGPAAAAIVSRASEQAISLAIRYIMDTISEAEFDAEVEQYIKDLEPAAIERQAYLDENK